MFHEHWFFVAKFKWTMILCSAFFFAYLPSLSLHECKHEDFFQGYISIIFSLWLPISLVSLCILRLSFYWSLHDRQCPLIGFHTSMGYIKTFSLWFHILWLAWALLYWIAWGLDYLLWSLLLILIIALGVSIMHLIPWLNVWLERTWLWVLNCMSDVWTLWYNTRTHWYTHWTFLYWLCDLISLSV